MVMFTLMLLDVELMDEASGALTIAGEEAVSGGPSLLAISPDKQTLYAGGGSERFKTAMCCWSMPAYATTGPSKCFSEMRRVCGSDFFHATGCDDLEGSIALEDGGVVNPEV